MTPDSAVSKKNRKKILFGVLAVGLVALLSIIMTWAYLRDKTDEKTHTFTLGQGVDILLTQAEDVDIKIIPGKEYSQLKAMVSIPASAMEKEYIATKVLFFREKETMINGKISLQYEPISYADFKKDYGEICSYSQEGIDDIAAVGTTSTGCRTDWTLDASSEQDKTGSVFYYTGNNTDGSVASVLHDKKIVVFDSVKMKSDYDLKYTTAVSSAGQIGLYDETGKFLKDRTIVNDGQLQGFKIVVCAYAVQGNISKEQGKEALENLVKSNP